MHLHARAVQPHHLHADADQPFALQVLEHPVEDAALRPAAHPRVDRVPVAEAFREAAPFAAVLRHVEDGVEHAQVRQADVAPLPRKHRLDPLVLRLGEFHAFDIP